MNEIKKALPKINIGYRVGQLVVEGKTEERKNGYLVWQCRCECGNTVRLNTKALQRGTMMNCGCGASALRRPGRKAIDMTGQRFGHLVCLHPEPDLPRKQGIQWLCRCDCGNECYATPNVLRAGEKKSCGCMRSGDQKRMIGRVIGDLKVLRLDRQEGDVQYWECVCSCGNHIVLDRVALENGTVRNCGCKPAVIAPEEKETEYSDPEAHVKGVTYNKRMRRWVARLNTFGEPHFLGSFTNREDAIEARRQALKVYAVHFPKALPKHITVICWEGALQGEPFWNAGWNYVDADAKYLIVQADQDEIDAWTEMQPGAQFGVSECGDAVRPLYRHAKEALKLCCFCGARQWHHNSSYIGNDPLLLRKMVEQRLKKYDEFVNNMIGKYGEVCTQKKAAELLNCHWRTVIRMLEDGRLRAVNCRVEVRSICEYLEQQNIQNVLDMRN